MSEKKEQKKTANEKNDLKWKDLVDRIPGGIGVYDLYPDDRVELRYINASLRQKIHDRMSFEDAKTAGAFHTLHSDDKVRLMACLRKTADGGAETNLDIRLRLRDNRYHWLNVHATVAEQLEDRVSLYLLFTNADAVHQARFMEEESHRAVQIASRKGDMSLWVYYFDTKRISQPFTGGMGSNGFPADIEGGPETIIGEGVIYPSDVSEYRRMFREMEEGAASSECTVRTLHRARNKFEWQHITLTRQVSDEIQTPMAIGFTINVELQKEAEIRYEREMRLRQELVKDSVIYYRINLSTAMVEELYSEAYDTKEFRLPVSMNQLVQNGLYDGIYEPDRKRLEQTLDPKQMLKNYESGKSTESFTYRRYLPGKGLRWLKASIAKLKRISSDDVIAFFTAIDIDDEWKDQLLYRDVMDEEIESLITLKPGTGMLRIIKDSRSLPGYEPRMSATGYFPWTEEFLQKLLADIVPEDQEGARQFISRESFLKELEKQPMIQFIYSANGPDGELRRKKLRVFYLDESRQDVIFVRRDITDLYNEQQRQSAAIKHAMDEAKAANEAKSDFLSRMSHDMRTPLNAIIGYSSHILRDGVSEAQKDEFLDDIHSAGEYLLGIINDVLDMTKIESNKMVLHPEPYSRTEFIQSVETVIRPLCSKKGVEFKLDFSENLPDSCMLDKVRFNQIFVNILSNAVKFTPAGGRILLSADCVDTGTGSLAATFQVADNGCGMSEEFIPHAFDSFSQEYAGQAMHREQGTGLGLSIVKQLVELMDGTISIESSLGNGSTFIVQMPLYPSDAQTSLDGQSFPKNGLRDMHLLLCEDHPMNSQIAVRLLEKEGCSVDTAGDGKQGLEKFKASQLFQYDAVLMDIRMPNMDGLEASKAIRSLDREDAASVPIIAMTANAFLEDRRASMEAGMNDHISKPIDPAEMYRTIFRQVNSRHVARTPKILVVDDIEMNAALVARVLRDEYDTIVCLSGEEALEQLKKNPYIIAVITDVQMPGMDGGELIRTIRKNPSWNRVALIANTQFGNGRVEEALMRDGADDFIYKPTAPSLIMSRVKNVIAKYR